MSARIYKPTKNAMQSGKARTRKWVLEYDAEQAREVEPLMGWTSSGDMLQQVRLSFESKDDALAYAKRNDITFRVEEPKQQPRKAKTYAENFRYGRIGLWTH